MQDDRDLRARVDRLYVCANAKRRMHAAADAVRVLDRSVVSIRPHMLMRPANRRLLKVGKVRLVRSKTFLTLTLYSRPFQGPDGVPSACLFPQTCLHAILRPSSINHSGRKSVWNHLNNEGLYGLQMREFPAGKDTRLIGENIADMVLKSQLLKSEEILK